MTLLPFSRYTTFILHVTGCDVKKSFVFQKELQLPAKCAFQFTCKHIVDNICCIPRYVKKGFNSKSDSQGHY